MLHPIAFGCSCTSGNKKHLHSHLGEAFSGNKAINKCRQMAFGQRFVWVMDSHILKFILSYDGKNLAILRLQMCFMCWDMVIKHRNNVCLTNSNYFSRLAWHQPLLQPPIKNVCPAGSHAMSLQPCPYDHAHCTGTSAVFLLRCKSQAPLPSLQPSVQATPTDTVLRSPAFINWPVAFGTTVRHRDVNNSTSRCLYNSDITWAAGMLAHFNWAVYVVNSSHFFLTITEPALPFKIVLACDLYVNGHVLFCKLMDCPAILNSTIAQLDHIQGLGITSKLTSYLIHSHWYSSTKPTSQFWDIRSNIVRQLQLICLVSIVVAFVHTDHDATWFQMHLPNASQLTVGLSLILICCTLLMVTCNDYLYVRRENGWPHTIMGLLHVLIQTLITISCRGIQLLSTSTYLPLAKVCRLYYIGRYSKFF